MISWFADCLAGALRVGVAVAPPAGHHLPHPVHLGGAPGGLGPGVAAPVVPHALVDERKDTDVS